MPVNSIGFVKSSFRISTNRALNNRAQEKKTRNLKVKHELILTPGTLITNTVRFANNDNNNNNNTNNNDDDDDDDDDDDYYYYNFI